MGELSRGFTESNDEPRTSVLSLGELFLEISDDKESHSGGPELSEEVYGRVILTRANIDPDIDMTEVNDTDFGAEYDSAEADADDAGSDAEAA